MQEGKNVTGKWGFCWMRFFRYQGCQISAYWGLHHALVEVVRKPQKFILFVTAQSYLSLFAQEPACHQETRSAKRSNNKYYLPLQLLSSPLWIYSVLCQVFCQHRSAPLQGACHAQDGDSGSGRSSKITPHPAPNQSPFPYTVVPYITNAL